MSIYSTQINTVVHNRLIPDIAKLALDIAAVEPYSYSGEPITTYRKRLTYSNLLFDFLTEYVDGNEEMDNYKLVNIVNLLGIPESSLDIVGSLNPLPPIPPLPPASPCAVFLVSNNKEIFSYEPTSGSLVLRLRYTDYNVSVDIASSDTKIWIVDMIDGYFIEYNITLNPFFSIVYNRRIKYTSYPGSGLASKDNTTLIGSNNDIITLYDISGDNSTTTPLFSIGANRTVTGDIIYNPISDTYIVCNHSYPSVYYYITEYSSAGVKLSELDITSYCTDKRAYSLFQSGDILYVIIADAYSNSLLNNSSYVYEITSNGLVYTESIDSVIYGGSQNVSCIDANLPIPPVSYCAVFMVDGARRVYSYETNTKTLTYRFTHDKYTWVASDISTSDTKLWLPVYEAGRYIFMEYDITLSPFTYAWNRDIVMGTYSGAGLSVKDDHTLIGTDSGHINLYDITTDTAVVTQLCTFSVADSSYGVRMCTGDILYNAISDTYIISNNRTNKVTNSYEYYITEFSNDGTIINEIDITYLKNTLSAYAYGMFQFNDKLYVTLTTGVHTYIYRIDSDGLVLDNTISNISINGASQNVSCITINLPTFSTQAGLYGGLYNWYAASKATFSYKDDLGALYNWYVTDIISYNDWFLPTISGIQAMYNNLYLYGVGNFNADGYWSSTEASVPDNDTDAIYYRFSIASTARTSKTATVWAGVRAARSFITTNVYNLRDIGPAGGYVFYIVDNGDGSFTYYEASPADLYYRYLWSNINTEAVGNSSYSIENSLTYTNNIINQLGHTDSAANLCANLVITKNDIAPAGWHVPSVTEFNTLSTVAGGLNAGTALKEAGIEHWTTDPNNSTNATGFTGRGSGYRGSDGFYLAIGTRSQMWTSTVGSPTTTANIRTLGDTNTNLPGGTFYKTSGCSIRLIKDDSDIGSGTLTDIDGNVYPTVLIGSQVWMAESLRVEHYNDGSDIPIITDNAIWAADTIGAMCYYKNAPDGISLLPPLGWHIPTNQEQEDLALFIEPGATYLSNSVGGKLKEVGNTHWNIYSAGTDDYDMTLLPGGHRAPDGVFSNRGDGGYWWANNESGAPWGYLMQASFAADILNYNFQYLKERGQSIRCIMDGVDPDDPGYVNDYDGNRYRTVKIGTQVWMAEDLRTTRYNNGVDIPNVTDDTLWSTDTEGAMCWYNNIIP